MKKILAILAMAVLLSPSLAQADARATMGKMAGYMSEGLQTKDDFPVKDAELKELADFVRREYQKTGVKLTQLQAAAIAGQTSAMIAIMEAQKKAREGKSE